ncbi:amino acid adenylation domain-containing protein, partial [Amycolatopsis pigmentata]
DIPRGTRLFDSILVFENYPAAGSAAELPHGITRQRRTAVEWQDYPISVVTHLADTFSARFTYDLGLFDPSAVDRMAGHFLTLLASVVANPSARLRELEMLTPAERRRLLVEWNDTAAEFPRDACVHELVQRREPDAIAVTFGSESLTYGQLNAQANQLARFLVNRGVRPGAVIGVCLPRSLELVVALLGVLKAGAAYVPLDPGYPAQRLAFMLSETAAPTVLTHSAVRFSVPAADVVVVDEDWPAISALSDTDLVAEVRPDDLAYVMYTSGSTGEPKGAEIRHDSIVSLAINGDYVDIVPGDVFLQLAPVSFDAATFEIWVPLINGATVAMAPPGAPDPAGLAEEIRRSHVTVAWLTAGLFHAVVDSDPRSLAGLRHVLAGGDVLSPSHVDRFRRALSGTRLTNGYGPTETTTFTCCADLTDAPYGLAGVPIGRPVANTTVYVVDRGDRLVPVGVPGELLVGGVGVARGYHNRPELTEERFTADPFSADPTARVYRTGDIVRWLPDGTLDFVGRLDDQVKLRGFRIEPGEVESVLAGHPEVSSCVVTVREDTPGDKRLVAYCVPAGTASAPVLREWCKRSLPEYLVPGAFVLLDALPLTANGKVDRRALPAPDGGRPKPATGYVPPRDPAEQAVARTWSEVLGVDQVGRYDNFFELGGDSILCIQVITRLKKFGIHVTPRLLFQHATVAEIVVAARASAPVVAEQGRVAGEAVLSPVQRWFFEWDMARPDRFNQSVMMTVQGLAPDALEPALAALADHHDMLRARFTREPHGWAQHIAEGAETVVRTHDLSAEPDAGAMIRTLADDAHRSVDLAAGPLLRAVLFDLGPDRGQRLLIVIHHLVVDGVSWRILLDDLANAYEQVKAGRSVLLSAKTTSFPEWSARLERYAGSAACLAELPYWNRPRPATGLPRDGDGANTFAAVRTVAASLGPEQTAALLRDVPRAFDTRINDVLLTALACALRDWTGQTACVIDMEGHGREDLFADVDLSRTVGWFTSIFPVVIDIGSAVDVAECLRQVTAQLDAVPNNGIGYGALRYAGSDAVRRQLGAQDMPEISLNYLGQYENEVPGLGRYADGAEPSGEPVDPATTRRHLIDVRCVVRDGDLLVYLDYTPSLHDTETIERVSAGLLDHLRALTAAVADSTTRSAADFPLSGLDEAALAAVLERFVE